MVYVNFLRTGCDPEPISEHWAQNYVVDPALLLLSINQSLVFTSNLPYNELAYMFEETQSPNSLVSRREQSGDMHSLV